MCWKGLCDKELRAASDEKPAGSWGPQSSSTWGTEFYQRNHVNLQADPFSSELLYVTPALAKTLVVPLWETLKQRSQLSYAWIFDSQKLWDNKYLLFQATKFCDNYAATENEYSSLSSSHAILISNGVVGWIVAPKVCPCPKSLESRNVTLLGSKSL